MLLPGFLCRPLPAFSAFEQVKGDNRCPECILSEPTGGGICWRRWAQLQVCCSCLACLCSVCACWRISFQAVISWTSASIATASEPFSFARDHPSLAISSSKHTEVFFLFDGLKGLDNLRLDPPLDTGAWSGFGGDYLHKLERAFA